MPARRARSDPELHHLLAHPADRKTICGISLNDNRAYPLLAAQHLPMHQAGHGPIDVCPVCERRLPLVLSQS